MEVILLEKIRNLGSLGETVKVKSGYARNFLIPQGKAVYATAANVAEVEKRRAELEQQAAKRLQAATARQTSINALPPIVLAVKASEEGKLFGSIGTRDIVNALAKVGAEIEKREIRLPEGALRMTGEYDILIELGGDLTATIKVNVVGEG